MPIERELQKWRDELEQELADLHDDYKNIESKMTKIRQQIEAIDQLLPSSQVAKLENGKRGSALSDPFTPVQVYWPTILQCLVELGGSARGEQVIDRVGQKLEHVLTPGDREMLPSGVDVRWRNRTAWQRYNMIRQGLLKANSPRGIWEISEEGRRWLEMRHPQK